MSIVIQGIAFPLGSINLNGWGVPLSEAENAINSLKKSVIRICNRAEEHFCDLIEDPYSEIGRITDAWQEGNSIYARGEITDSEAETKILEGTWDKKWSVYGVDHGTIDGFSQGFQAKSMTLVRFPAWPEAVWHVSASETGKRGLSFSSDFEVLGASDNFSKKCSCRKKQGGHMPQDNKDKTVEEQLAEAQAQLTEANKQIEEMKGQAGQIETLTASNKKLEEDNKKNLARIAALEKDKAVSLTLAEVNELITKSEAKAASQAKNEVKEEMRREAALNRVAAARKTLGMKEVKTASLDSLKAEDLEETASDLEELVKKASKDDEDPKGPVYPVYASSAQGNGANTGIYNPFTGGWT